MSRPVKAIETRYKGYRFRSRLEARWAVFFDTLELPWEYEKEGYHLDSGLYLPDFWLPSLEAWLEVKPVAPTDEERKLCEELAEGTDHPVIIGIGLPGSCSLLVYCSDTTDGSGGTDWWGDVAYESVRWALVMQGYHCHYLSPYIVLDSGNNFGSRAFLTPNWNSWSGMALSFECLPDDPSILAAYSAARSARFEHGETPS